MVLGTNGGDYGYGRQPEPRGAKAGTTRAGTQLRVRTASFGARVQAQIGAKAGTTRARPQLRARTARGMAGTTRASHTWRPGRQGQGLLQRGPEHSSRSGRPGPGLTVI